MAARSESIDSTGLLSRFLELGINSAERYHERINSYGYKAFLLGNGFRYDQTKLLTHARNNHIPNSLIIVDFDGPIATHKSPFKITEDKRELISQLSQIYDSIVFWTSRLRIPGGKKTVENNGKHILLPIPFLSSSCIHLLHQITDIPDSKPLVFTGKKNSTRLLTMGIRLMNYLNPCLQTSSYLPQSESRLGIFIERNFPKIDHVAFLGSSDNDRQIFEHAARIGEIPQSSVFFDTGGWMI